MADSVKQLELDFQQKKEALNTAVEQFSSAAEALAGSPAQPAPSEQSEALRGEAKRLVGILRDQSGIGYHAVWVLAYHELFKRTGFHAVEPGNKTHLDRVEEEGRMQDFIEAVAAMLRDPAYAPGATKR